MQDAEEMGSAPRAAGAGVRSSGTAAAGLRARVRWVGRLLACGPRS
jgi:hypothetical protein